MASDSICCRCTQPKKLKRMSIEFLVLCTLLSLAVQTSAAPDYKKLHESLSLKKDAAHSHQKSARRDGTPIVAEIGKIFKLPLDEYILNENGGGKPTIRIFEHGKDGLPLWLSYNEEKNRLVGLPTLQDKNPVKIILKTSYKGLKKKHKFEIDVREARDRFHCHHGNPAFVAAAILNVDVSKYSGLQRFKLFKHFSKYIDVSFHDIIIEEKSVKNIPDVTIETSGPGDYIKSNSPDLIVKWKVDCKRGIAGDFSVNTLRASSGNQRIFSAVGVPFRGWYVYRHQGRVRRQVFPAATPVATPAATIPVPGVVTTVISGTPVISATPTIIIKATTTIAVVASTSTPIVVKPTPVVTKKPPTTTPETTTGRSTSTQPPSTTKPPTTTKEPTTEKSTSEMVTTQPTTKETTTKEVIKITTEREATTATSKPIKTVKTTMKPKTTLKQETTVKVPATTKMQPTIPVTVKKDMPPVLKNSIDLINAKVGQAVKVKIERDIFEDDLDGDTYGLILALKRNNAQKLIDVDRSLIYLDTQGRYLYMLPMLDDIGDNSFALQATDRAGNQKNAVFTVKVTDEIVEYNDIFNVTIDIDFDQVAKNAMRKVMLVERVAQATDVDYRSMRVQNFYRGSVIMSYSSTELQTDTCNSVEAEAYKAKLEGSEFKDEMAPDYVVVKTSHAKRGKNCGGGGGTKHPTKTARSGAYKWWEVVLIPVIVIAVLLLIIGFIFFFLYRRKRRYAPHKEDQKTFLYQKKPVIFREEYDEKPEVVSLDPLVLPNEKEPLTNSAYEPRSSTPDGNGSSSGSTEPDEKRLIDNRASPQAGPPRSPNCRSPPPYTEP